MKKKPPKKKQDLVDAYLLLDTIELALFALGLNIKLLEGEKLTKKELKALNCGLLAKEERWPNQKVIKKQKRKQKV